MWIEYRHKFASHIQDKGSYVELPNMDHIKECGYKDIGEYISSETEIMEQHSWSDKYRGIDYDVVDFPPIDYIADKIKSHISHLEWHEAQLKRFRRMLDDTGYINKEEFNV